MISLDVYVSGVLMVAKIDSCKDDKERRVNGMSRNPC